MSHASQLDYIHFIHQFRNPVLDLFFKFLNFFDRQEFFFILIPIVWLWYGWKTGLRVCYILLLSGVVNHALKELFALPRPFHIDRSLGLIHVGGFGFPSGAAQSVTILSGLLLLSGQSFWKWLLVIPYFVLVSFSRVYLGVHFPTDLLGGYVVGLSLLALYVYVWPMLEKQLEKLSPRTLLFFSQLIPLLFILFFDADVIIRICSVMMGVGLGVFAAYRYKIVLEPPQTTKEYVFRAFVGVFGTFLCYALMRLVPIESYAYLFVRFAAIGLWVSLLSPLICRKYFNKSLKVTHG